MFRCDLKKKLKGVDLALLIFAYLLCMRVVKGNRASRINTAVYTEG